MFRLMKKLNNKKQAGFTIAEVMVALAVLVIGLGSSAASISMATRIQRTNRNITQALQQSRLELEKLRQFAYNNSNLALGTYNFTRTGYTGTYSITQPATNMKKISMQVTYTDAVRKTSDTVEVSTVFSRAVH